VLSDVLEDHTFIVTAQSLREFRSYDGTYLNQSHRLRFGVSLFDSTSFFYAAPYDLDPGFNRQGAFATRRLTGALFSAAYPLNKYHRLEASGGFLREKERFENDAAQQQVEAQAEALGIPFAFNDGNIAPVALRLVGETTRFREFGPLSGSTYLLGVEASPGFGNMIERTTLDADLRHYQRLFGDVVVAARFRGHRSTGRNPSVFYFGGNMDLRGYPYLSFAGHEGFHANLELRFPIIQLMATPLGIFGPVRGTFFAGIGGAHFKGEEFTFATREDGISSVNSVLFGEPVSGLHLVDGRASFGFGLHAFLFGLPMHFDWSKLTDLQVVSKNNRFDFWIGYDF
jgi:outer membrane protein assembly factor BamA